MAATLVVRPPNGTLPEMNVSIVFDLRPDFSPSGLRSTLLSWKPDLWEVTKVTLLLLTMVVSLIGNSFIISVSRRLFQQSAVLRSCLVSMAVVHLLMALTVPLHLGVIIIPRFLQLVPLCVMLYASVTFYVTLTLGHLVLLSIDRVVALRHPLQFHQFFKSWHAAVLLFALWLYTGCSAGALLLWQLEGPGRQPCHPEVYLGQVYRLLHLVEYAVGAILALTMLFAVYFLSCKKHRMDVMQHYARRRRRAVDFSLRRNKLFAETLITMGSLFLAMCGPYFGIKLIHFFTVRTMLTSAIQNIAVLIIIMHSFVNAFVLPWKIRSYRYRCLYCVCPCAETHRTDVDLESEDENDNTPQVTHIRNCEVGESNTDSLYKNTGSESMDKACMLTTGYIPNITITDYDSQKRITLRSDGQVEKQCMDNDPIWSTINSNKHPLTDDEFAGSTANLYFLNPVDNDFLDIPTEDEV